MEGFICLVGWMVIKLFIRLIIRFYKWFLSYKLLFMDEKFKYFSYKI